MKRAPMGKPHNSEARYLQKLFKVTMPSPKKISVADIMNADIPDSPTHFKDPPNSRKKTKWTEMARADSTRNSMSLASKPSEKSIACLNGKRYSQMSNDSLE